MGRHLLLSTLVTGLLGLASAAMAGNLSTPAGALPAVAAKSAATSPAAGNTSAATPAADSFTATTQAAPAAATQVMPPQAEGTPAAATEITPATVPASVPAQTTSEETGPAMPVRGMNMANVEHIFGAPLQKLPAVPAVGNKLHPPITRWVYPHYVVYFEYNDVIHSVLKAHPFAGSSHRDG
ncbi:MAG: hypothetical protein ACYDB9_03010 [Gammaproteobacteria bacterium]